MAYLLASLKPVCFLVMPGGSLGERCFGWKDGFFFLLLDSLFLICFHQEVISSFVRC